jgi:prevent-host-death family protein
MEIGIREFKDRLSEILHRASAGEEITVTLHGQPICQIAQAKPSELNLPDYLLKAAAEGSVQLPTTSGLQEITRFNGKRSKKSSLELLQESRKERSF